MDFWNKLAWPWSTRLSKEALKSTSSFCMMPWVHLHVTQLGTVTPCCQAPWQEEFSFGNINNASIKTIWNSKKMNRFRSGMLKGKTNSRCSICYEKEASGALSLRQLVNKDYNHRLNWVHETSSSGRVANAKPVYFDIRFSNICNLKCRICGPWASSQWHQDSVALGTKSTDSKSLTKAFDNKISFFEKIEIYLDAVEEIYFAGGEPLMMEEHYQLLEILIDRKRFDVKLKYNTNFSTLSFKHWNLLPLWKHFSHINVAASLDASGKRGEFLRKNLQWTHVLENRKRMLEEIPHIDFMISPTTYIYNVWHLPQFHREWVDLGLIQPEDFVPTILISPEYFNIRIIPEVYKKNLVVEYKKHIKWLVNTSFVDKIKGEHVIQQFKNVIEHLNQMNKTDLLPEFYTKSLALDELRSEKTDAVFPELAPLIQEIKTNI